MERNYYLDLAIVFLFGVLFVLSAAIFVKCEESVSDEGALEIREAEWLALRAGLYNPETHEADKAAAEELRKILVAVRTLHPKVASIIMPLGAMPDTTLEMTVEGAGAFPPEVDALINMAGSRIIVFGEKDDDPVRLHIYFHRLLHAPSLLARVSGITRVKGAKESRKSFDEYDFPMSVGVAKFGADTWSLLFREYRRPTDDSDFPKRMCRLHFIVELDRKALAAEVQPAVVGYGMKIEKAGEEWDK